MYLCRIVEPKMEDFMKKTMNLANFIALRRKEIGLIQDGFLLEYRDL